MAIRIFPQRGSFKPSHSAINWGHPLAQGLVAYMPMLEGGGAPRDLVSGQYFTGNVVPNWSTLAPYGSAATEPAVSVLLAAANPAQSDLGAAPITLMGFGNVTSLGALSMLIGRSTVGTSTNQYLLGKTGANALVFTVRFGTDCISSITLATGPLFAMASWDGSNTRFFYNGTMETDVYSTTVQGTGITLSIMGTSDHLQLWPGGICGGAVWKRALSFTEMQSLYANPYAMLMPAVASLSNFLPLAGDIITVTGNLHLRIN